MIVSVTSPMTSTSPLILSEVASSTLPSPTSVVFSSYISSLVFTTSSVASTKIQEKGTSDEVGGEVEVTVEITEEVTETVEELIEEEMLK